MGFSSFHNSSPNPAQRYYRWSGGEKKVEVNGETVSGIIDATCGKIIFNDPVPQDLGFIDRSNPDNIFTPEVDTLVNKKVLGRIIERCIRVHGTAKSATVA